MKASRRAWRILTNIAKIYRRLHPRRMAECGQAFPDGELPGVAVMLDPGSEPGEAVNCDIGLLGVPDQNQ
jgi:hypothetical protein